MKQVIHAILLVALFQGPLSTRATEVVVVGAGIAGLAAARRLVDDASGEYTVTILEARPERWGGRIWTARDRIKRAKGVEVDLGASMINTHIEENPIKLMQQEFGLGVGKLSMPSIRRPGGQIFSRSEVKEAQARVSQVINSALKAATNRVRDVSLEQAIGEVDQSGASDLDKYFLSAWGSSAKNLSAKLFNPSIGIGWDEVIVDGYDEIINRILSGVGGAGPLEVDLGQEVREIRILERSDRVQVRTTSLRQLDADAVIVSIPLGVLRDGSVLFSPPLPPQKQQAIHSIGIQFSNKLVLEFDSVFWPEDEPLFGLADSEPPGFLQTWINLLPFVHKPILQGLVSGSDADIFEALSDAALKERALTILGKLFGVETKNLKITTMIRSSWGSDPYSRGGVPYPAVGNTAALWEAMAAPLCPSIYFAGDHTTLAEHGTAHGAYKSGIRAAEELIKGRKLCPNDIKTDHFVNKTGFKSEL